ncbi:hypothetical protein CPLU01_02693 [Colletotrichum plurivorum]|uniref:S-adenosylmethionine-dependent methyltransferase-like protein n=1 Tax=Colletotrichum plurivorum TaxID=2175906 RepID=A0A8H6NMI1_9PEZI|nr:hypothetical protein CPLU01_02693 [Colletotrichum plurivorum]
MPAFGRIGKHHNRSQQALVEPVGGGASASASGPGSGPGPASGSAPAVGSSPVPAPAAPSSAHSHHSHSHSLAPAPAPASSTSTATTPTSAVGANHPITPHSASSTAFSSIESFDAQNQLQHQQHQQQFQQQQQHQQHQHHLSQQQQQQQQQQGQKGQQQGPPPPPPHDYTPASAAASRNSLLVQHNPPAAAADSRQRGQQEFADSVSRSQSQRYPPAVAPYPNSQYGAASSSVDNLRASLNNTSSAPGQPQPTSPVPQPAPPPEKRSARRLLKNILSGAGRDHHHASPPSQPTPPGSYDNTGGLARRPSKRVSKPPPPQPPATIALTQQPSQLSLDQQSADWPLQPPQQQPSPLQGVGEVEDHHRFVQDPNRDPRLQNPESHRSSIRYVPSDLDNTPYDDPAYHQQQVQQLHALQQQHQQQLDQQAAYDPSQQQQYHDPYSQQQRGQYPGGPSPIYTGHLGTGSHQNPETISQLSHESPVTDSDARSANVQSAQTSPAVRYAVQTTDNPLPSSLPPSQQGAPQAQQQNMAPPPAGGPPPRSERRPQQPDTEKSLRSQVDAPSGPPPGYRQSQTMPPATGGANPGYRTSSAQEGRQFEGATGEQGRNSPQPSNPDRDGTDPDKFKELLTKYKNVKRLYFDGKTQIDNLNSQIEQLQNAIANQRMSQSRTSLDDSEYITRFNRLNGAINNLSFNIRKDWRTVPQWLDMYVSIDALKTGKQEMTAVGRAVITRWIVEEIFNKCFHPGLNFDLSRQLKEIELNIRRFSYTMNSQEEFDALTNKVVSWRMATLEGLQVILNSPESADNRADFTRMCTSNLTATLFQYMTDPPPPGVDGSASMIVELAVGIASNLPMESRDVAITYPLPGDPINPNVMEVEKAPLPALDTQKAEGDGDDSRAEEADKDKNGKDRRADKTRSGMFTTILGGGPPRKGSNASSIVPSSTDAAPSSALPPKDSNKVRLAGFPVVEVRGRQVLMKAPVWTL